MRRILQDMEADIDNRLVKNLRMFVRYIVSYCSVWLLVLTVMSGLQYLH